jgi:hypothetical protein
VKKSFAAAKLLMTQQSAASNLISALLSLTQLSKSQCHFFLVTFEQFRFGFAHRVRQRFLYVASQLSANSDQPVSHSRRSTIG